MCNVDILKKILHENTKYLGYVSFINAAVDLLLDLGTIIIMLALYKNDWVMGWGLG